MLSFYSAGTRIVNSERAVAECFDLAFGSTPIKDCRAFIINTTLGHQLKDLANAIEHHAPGVPVFGSSASGVISREGAGESMHDIAMMAICGPEAELGYATVSELYGHNAYEKALELAQKLKTSREGIHTIYLLCPGIDTANDLILKAFIETFGESINIFGGTSSDNMRGLVNYQFHSGVQSEHAGWAIGFADPTLSSVTRATHGFSAYGEPMVVTKASGNKIFELDGRPAWQEYTSRLSLPETAHCGETIPVGALAQKLTDEQAVEYGNSHILRVITKHDEDGTMYFPTTCEEGLELWLTTRDEDLIFSEQERSLNFIVESLGGKKPVAVFQTDCLARGRFLFNKVMKDEIIAMMHSALNNDGATPPWLGMYGFGEYAWLQGKNTYHNYSTALLVLSR